MTKDNKGGRNVPELRFKGFTGDWEQRKLGELVSRLKSYPLSRNVETSEDSGYRYIHYGDIHTRIADVIKDETVLPKIFAGNYNTIEIGDLCLADASEDYQDIAAPSILLAKHKDSIVAGLHTIALRPHAINPLFLYFSFMAPDFRHYVYREGQGLKVFGISASNIFKYKYVFPSADEQTRIVELLSALDRIIVLHERKLELLKKLKEAYLQQIFPQNGAKIPQLRFASFTCEWEQRKLGEMYMKNTERNEGKFSTSKTITLAAMKFNPMGNGAAQESLQGYTVLRRGDIAFEGHTSKSFSFGRFVLNDIGDGIMSPRFTSLRPIKQQVLAYWKQYIHYEPIMRIILVKSTKAGTMMNELVPQDFFNESIRSPSVKEQEKIGRLLANIDNIITLHERLLDQYNGLKKAFLQNLFV